MIVELGILPQSTMKRTRRSRATFLESAMKLPIRGTSMCRIARLSGVRMIRGVSPRRVRLSDNHDALEIPR
jgi:hypothetical protein